MGAKVNNTASDSDEELVYIAQLPKGSTVIIIIIVIIYLVNMHAIIIKILLYKVIHCQDVHSHVAKSHSLHWA